MTTKSLAGFINHFAGIRVVFNWDLLLSKKWEICTIGIDTRDQLGELCCPWYRNGMDFTVPYDACGATPITVRCAGENFLLLDGKKRRGIGARQFAICEHRRHPSRLHLPAYTLPNNRFLLLDGNHRAIAAYMNIMDLKSDVKLEATIWAIRGPMDEDVLPDLKHYCEA